MEGIEAVRREIGAARGEKDGAGAVAADANDKGKGKGKESAPWDHLAGAVAEDDKTVWLHCSVGDVMEDDEIEGERIQVRRSTQCGDRGFQSRGLTFALGADHTNHPAARI